MFEAINGWTKKQIIDNIKLRFKGQSYNPLTETCEYLSEDGLQCAVGMFIPVPLIEKLGRVTVNAAGGVTGLLMQFPYFAGILPLDKEGLIAFQLFHDNFERKENKRLTTEHMVQWVQDNVK